MASIRSRYNKLVVDFRYMGVRCRETTNLVDNPANRKKLEKAIEKMNSGPCSYSGKEYNCSKFGINPYDPELITASASVAALAHFFSYK